MAVLSCQLDDLPPGDLFRIEDVVYLKTAHKGVGDGWECIRLRDGRKHLFVGAARVEPVAGRLPVRRAGDGEDA
jgi:hypothetical protein